MSSHFTVNAVSLAELPAACRVLACARRSNRDFQTRAYLEAFTSRALSPRGLLAAKDQNGAIHGAILAQVIDGAVGILWPPGIEASRDGEDLEMLLVKAALAWLRAAGVKVAQSLPRVGDREGMGPLERAGFRLITRLSMWGRDLATSSHIPKPKDTVTFIPAQDSQSFRDTLLATYEGSLDCPESAGDRTPAELVAGHGPAPDPHEPLWFLAQTSIEPIGVVMLSRTDATGVGELTYLGLRPSARGRDLGRELIRFAIARSVEVGFHKLTLSVDVRNEPALQLYRRHGFRRLEERDVYNLVLTDGTEVF